MEPAAKLEAVALLLGDEVAPDVCVVPEPLVGAGQQDVVRQDVVVAEGGHDGDGEPRGVAGGEDMGKAVGDLGVGAEDLVGVAREALVAVVAGAVASPDDKVYRVAQVGGDPVEGGVDEREWAVAVGRLGAVCARGAASAVARAIFVG